MDFNNNKPTLSHRNNTRATVPVRPPARRTQIALTLRPHPLARHHPAPAYITQVGIAFSKKRKRTEAATVEDLMFSRINLP